MPELLTDEEKRAKMEALVAMGPSDEELFEANERKVAKEAIEEYLELFRRLLPLEPKMAAALLPKAHRKALEYCKLVGDE